MITAGQSDQGKSRSANQDSYVIRNDADGNCLALVCDGVGGANHGETASRLTVENISRKFDENERFRDLEDAQAWFFAAINETNTLVHKRGNADEEFRGMGTTLVGLLKTEFGTLIANVGDSRAYSLYEDGTFKVITKDHSYVNKLIESGQISKEEAAHHPHRHVITNAIGIWERVTVDFFRLTPDVHTVMLCSDGIHDYVDEALITEVIRNKALSPAEQAEKLINAANDAGGYDNATVIIIRFGGSRHE